MKFIIAISFHNKQQKQTNKQNKTKNKSITKTYKQKTQTKTHQNYIFLYRNSALNLKKMGRFQQHFVQNPYLC